MKNTGPQQQQGHTDWSGLSAAIRDQWIACGNAVIQSRTQNLNPEQLGQIAYEGFNGQSGALAEGAAAGTGTGMGSQQRSNAR